MSAKARSELNLVSKHHSAAALLDPLRLRILETLQEPDSATGLARRLGLPRQKVNYHLRELEKHRLVEVVEERRKGNCCERIVRATARFYLISPSTVGSLAADPSRIADHFSSAYLVAVAARAIEDLGWIQQQADRVKKKVATLTLQTEITFASAGDRNAFAEEVAECLARLATRYHKETAGDGRRFKFFFCGYPAITKKRKEKS